MNQLIWAIALVVRVTRNGLRRDEIARRLIWATAFVFVVLIWNGRRVVNAVVLPLWGRIRHYADLHAALCALLSAVPVYVAYRVTNPPA